MNFSFFAQQEIDLFDENGNYHSAQAYVDEVEKVNLYLFIWIDVISSSPCKPFPFDFAGTTGVAVSRHNQNDVSFTRYKILPQEVGYLTVWLSDDKSITIEFDMNEKYLIDSDGNKFDLVTRTESKPLEPLKIEIEGNEQCDEIKIKH